MSFQRCISTVLFCTLFTTSIFSLNKLGEFPVVGTVNDIETYKDYVLTTHSDSGLQVYDISNSALPLKIGSYDTLDKGEYYNGIAVSGDFAYIAASANGLEIVSLADPANPVFVGIVKTEEEAIHVAVKENVAYVACGSHGMHCVDVSTPASPSIIGSYYVNADSSSYHPVIECAVQGDYAYIAFEDSGLHIVNISNPAAPTFAGRYIEDDDLRIWGVRVSGDYAYLAAYDEGLRIVDISNPSSPTFTGEYDVPDNKDADSWDVAVMNNHAFILYQPWGIYAIDVSAPATPIYEDKYPEGTSIGNDYRQMALSSSYAFIYNDDKNKVEIIDIRPIIPIIYKPENMALNSSFIVQNNSKFCQLPIVIHLNLTELPSGKQTIDLALYSSNGKRVYTFFDGILRNAKHTITWNGIYNNGQKLPSGVYYCRLSVDGIGEGARKVVLRD